MENKEYFVKKAQIIECKILELQAQLAKIQNYIKTEKFPKKSGKKSEKTPKKDGSDDSGWF